MQKFSSIRNQNKNQHLSDSFLIQKKHSSFFKPIIQPKLTINQPNDIYEQEADAVADKVMRMPGKINNENAFFKPASNFIHRKCEQCEEEEKLNRKEGNTSPGESSIELENYVGDLNSGGAPLSNETRSFFEPRFGHDFSNVKIHTDAIAAKSAQSINALAYTSRNNIVFNFGQYNPQSGSGKKLLAHELSHVIQQTSAAPGIQREELTADQKLKDCMKQTDDILPGHVGALTHLDRSLMLVDMFGTELPSIIAKIKSDSAARRFICEYGISGIAALVETQQGAAFDIPSAKAAVDESIKTKSGKFGRKTLGNWKIGELRISQARADSGNIGSWAKSEDRAKDDIPSPSAALNMPAMQVAAISSMINNLELLNINYSASTRSLTEAQKSLDEIGKIFSSAIALRQTVEYGMDVSHLMEDANTEIDSLHRSIFAISAGRINLIDLETGVSNAKTETESIKRNTIEEQKKMLNGGSPDYSDVRSSIRETRSKTLKGIREGFTNAKSQIENTGKNLPKLLFVLKYFRGLNDSKTSAPTEAEMNLFNGQLDSIEATLFFGEGPVNPGLEIMQSVIDFVKKQVAIRLQMKLATGNLPGLIPSLAEVEAYFTTFNNKKISNANVRLAYEAFAQAYFQHRVIASMQDLNISGISDVFSLPASITGSRSIVCGGYAQMGAALMSRAGASGIIYTIAVRATKEQIKSNSIDAGHAIVKVNRQKGTFYISNYLTNNTETEAMDVAWEHPEYPMYKASSTNYNDAVKKLADQLGKVK